jgi:hypothetical protein
LTGLRIPLPEEAFTGACSGEYRFEANDDHGRQQKTGGRESASRPSE